MTAISIIIPVYNIEKYLKICLDSVLAQTFKDFEVICVNDGSKDNSLEILNKYALADSRIKVINQENGGSGSARNRGLRNAQGKYVQFLDGDDYFEPDMLEKIYNLAENHQAEIAVCSSKKVDDNGNITETKNPNSPLNLSLIPLNKPFSYKDFPKDIFSLTGTAPWNKLYLRDLLIKNNLKFPKLTGPDDLCFVHMAIVCAEKIVAIDDELINYRYNRPGSVQTYRANHTIDIIRAFLFIKDFLESKKIYNLLEKAYVNALTFSVRWETSLCNKEQYNKFIEDLKILFPNDWSIFEPALKKDFVTLDYLYNFIGEEKVYLWGASNYLNKLLEDEKNPHPNIIGIIDKNEAAWGKNFGNYKIFSPDILKSKPANVLVTIYNNHEQAHYNIKKELETKYSNIRILDNFFFTNENKKEIEKKFCPFCNEKFWFKTYGIVKRENAQYPIYHSLERHRILYYIYKFLIPDNKKIKILHTAPEEALSKLFLDKENIEYYSIDLYPEKYKHVPNCLKMNVLDLNFPENTFDFILSNHVIEHIEDEKKFIEEITRVLKPDGKAILSAPCDFDLEKTYEDLTIITIEDRLEAFGQSDHVRKYGADIFDRIRKYAKVTPIDIQTFEGIPKEIICNEISPRAIMIIEKLIN